jgi:hypothetical protein
MDAVNVSLSSNTLITGFAVIVVLLLAILVAVLRRPQPRGAMNVSAPAPTFAASPAYEGFAGTDGHVIAVIAAAVAMMGQQEGKRLVVRAVRRDNGWADAGRRESLY